MATVTEDFLAQEGISGKLDGHKTKTPLSEPQMKHRMRFKNANAFAKAILKDAAGKAYYEELAMRKRYSSAYNAAITDYFKRLTSE